MTTPQRNEQDANISFVTTHSSWLALCPLPTSPGIKKTLMAKPTPRLSVRVGVACA